MEKKTEPSPKKKKVSVDTGLAGMIVGETEIATVGGGKGLNYRGYNIDDLTKNSSCFEEVVYLLLVGELPT